jgi:ABC-type transport system involved in multi-copper enzyme maturation permease subunit
MNKILAVAGVVLRELCRRKDFYVLFILTALITLLMGAVGGSESVGALKEVCLLLILISSVVIAVTTTARQIPVERETRTIFPLLAKPISRTQVLLGKFAGCWLASGLALLVFYLFFAVVAASREHALPVISYAQAFWLQWQGLGIVTAMTLLGSLVLSEPAPNITLVIIITTGCLYLGRYLNKVALQYAEPGRTLLYALYFAIPHMEFFDMRDLIIHNWAAVAWADVALATLYGYGYMAVFLLAACLLFRRKALN